MAYLECHRFGRNIQGALFHEHVEGELSAIGKVSVGGGQGGQDTNAIDDETRGPHIGGTPYFFLYIYIYIYICVCVSDDALVFAEAKVFPIGPDGKRKGSKP